MWGVGDLYGSSTAFTVLVFFFKGYPTIKLLCNAMCCVLCLLVSFSLSCLVFRPLPICGSV